jgi:hypothetical protein
MTKTCSLASNLDKDDDLLKIADPDLPVELPFVLFEGVALSSDLRDNRLVACLLELQPIEDRRLLQG